jgi:hypothetical protein
MITPLRRRYGAGPLHLLALLASFALCGFALSRLLDAGPATANVALWLLGSVVAADLVLFPLYSLLDRIADGALRGTRVPAINHVRVPALLSGLLLLVYAPLILRLSGPRYDASTSVSADVYFGRWLAITAALFTVSAVAYAIRARRAR